MPFFLLLVLHLRATWIGLAYTGYSDLAGWARGQIFFLGVVLLLAAAKRAFPRAARLLPIPVAILAFGLAVASWGARTTGDTFHILGTEGSRTSLKILSSSIYSEADGLLALDLLLALAATAAAFQRRRKKTIPADRRLSLAGAGLAAALMWAGAAREPKDPRLESPLLALLHARRPEALPIAGERVADLKALRYGSMEIPAELRRELKARRDSLAEKKGRRPNVVLLFLESTGSGQIRPEGRWDPELTPNILALSRGGVLFPSVYAPFPGTVRSHLAVMTGGHTITWGSVYKEISERYLGPTLPGELKSRGYRNGFFSASFDIENMDSIYKLLPFDERFFPESLPPAYLKAHLLNSWGIDDREIGSRALAWAKKGPEPFLLVLNFDATHHPYDVPPGFAKIRAGGGNRARFDNALHFVDAVAGSLAEGLIAAGKGDTLFVLMGDHGEAFGDLHPGNFTHRNFIYEENVRSFVLIADLKKRLKPLEAEFPAGHGGVMPAVLDLVDQRDTPGSLFEPKAEIQYFYKNAHPEQWGLRDGEWKFIGRMLAPENPELYRLSDDPRETRNLAAQYPERVNQYRNLAAQWYLDTQNDFLAKLEGYAFAGGEGLKPADLGTPGPKRLAFGTLDKNGKFTPATKLPASAKIAVYTMDIPYPKGAKLLYQWKGPDGGLHSFVFFHQSEWSDVYAFPQQSFPMPPGKWKLRILDRRGVVLRGELEVTP